jgi:hypothetical protein
MTAATLAAQLRPINTLREYGLATYHIPNTTQGVAIVRARNCQIAPVFCRKDHQEGSSRDHSAGRPPGGESSGSWTWPRVVPWPH